MNKTGIALGATAVALLIGCIVILNVKLGTPAPVSNDELTEIARQTIADGVNMPETFRPGYETTVQVTSLAGYKKVSVSYKVDDQNGGVLPQKYYEDHKPWEGSAYSKNDHPTDDDVKQLTKDAAKDIAKKAKPMLAGLAKLDK